jgi:hypothetical protein
MAGLLSSRRSATPPPLCLSRKKNSTALCPVRPPQTAIGRPVGTLLGSAPVPVAVSGVAPKTVSAGEHNRPRLSGSTPSSNSFPPARCCQRGRWQPHARARALPPFIHRKLPLAARLGLCWGARPSRWPFSASRPPSSQRDNPTIARRFNAGSSPAPARVPPGRLNAWHSVSAIVNDFDLQTSVVSAGLGSFAD